MPAQPVSSTDAPDIAQDIQALEAALAKKDQSVDGVREAVANIARHKPAVDRGEVTGGTAQALRAVLAKAVDRPELKGTGLLELAIPQMKDMRGKLDELLGPDQGPKVMETVPEGLRGALRALRELVTRVRDTKAALATAQAKADHAFFQALFPAEGTGQSLIGALVAGRGEPFIEGQEVELGREIARRTMELSRLLANVGKTEREGIETLRKELKNQDYALLLALLEGDLEHLQQDHPGIDRTELFRIRAKVLNLKDPKAYPKNPGELYALGVRVENLPELAGRVAVELANLSAPTSHGPRPGPRDRGHSRPDRNDRRSHDKHRPGHTGSRPGPRPEAKPAPAPTPAAPPDPEAFMTQPPEDLRDVYNPLRDLVKAVRGNQAALTEAQGIDDPFLRAIFGLKEVGGQKSILVALDAKNNTPHDELRGKIEAETAKLRALLDQHKEE